MAVRLSSNLRQGLRFIGNKLLTNGAPSKPVVPGSGSRTSHSPVEEFGLRSMVVAGLVFCTSSGALLYTEHFNGRNKRDGVSESGATTTQAPSTATGDHGCNNWTPIVRVSNASSPSTQGGCLSRFAIADAAARAAPAVVNVKVSIGRRNAIFGETAGSGFIIQSDGTILTNAHVVAHERRGLSKGSLVVTLQDGRNFEGEVVSYDSLSDLAVIKVNSSRPLPVVKLGTSKDLRPVVWIGKAQKLDLKELELGIFKLMLQSIRVTREVHCSI